MFRDFLIYKEGIYHGQCSEICGVNHAFMPIVIKAVSKEEYKIWLEQAKQKFARANFMLQRSLVILAKYMPERFQEWGLRTGGLSLAQTTQAREGSKVCSLF